MLKFYYHPLSPISRRVWLALLEKEISFEPIIVDLPGKAHLQPEYLALNPFHHVPVIQDEDFCLIESLAILDYLEYKYNSNSLMPTTPEAIATMKMIQLVTVNELMPKISKVIMAADHPLSPKLAEPLHQVTQFLENGLGDRIYFGGNALNLADIVVGATVPLFERLGFSLTPYPGLGRWCQTITTRSAWQVSSPTDAALDQWKQLLQRWIKADIKRQQRRAKGLTN